MDKPQPSTNWELLEDWFTRMALVKDEYSEPILEDSTVNFIKSICEALKLDIYVFVMAVDVLERYIETKNAKRQLIEDKMLTLSAVILICSKSNGELSDLKVTHINKVMHKLIDTTYSLKDVCKAEMDVMKTLNDKIPITTKVDEVNTFIEKYVKDGHLKANIRRLSVNILELMYLQRSKWFYDLKKHYKDSEENRKIFRLLVCSKFYLPIGILYCALNLTKYKNFLKVKQLIKEISAITRIHVDHIQILSNTIFDIVLLYLPVEQ
ncbi:unnamed protein product [Brassicogethes aeneus]|uniref:Cyclin N-terminal domain-containing protein n=1 Tax=Brassicogethes aeneus TaxID=1431903 RepID=A0A9P0FR39_BRAAE|nr:unnamed protein product [Brassicogethes aeneus]